jgi:hypothetical protein
VIEPAEREADLELEHYEPLEYDPLNEYDDPAEGEYLRWRSLTLEQQADELNRRETLEETGDVWRVEHGRARRPPRSVAGVRT